MRQGLTRKYTKTVIYGGGKFGFNFKYNFNHNCMFYSQLTIISIIFDNYAGGGIPSPPPPYETLQCSVHTELIKAQQTRH